jgi:serine/threonine protein kinase
VLEAVGPVDLGMFYRAEDSSSHVEVDLLLLQPAATARLRPQFFRAAAIKHPNVAGVRAVGQTPEGVCYVALEVLRGELLSEILQARQILPLAEATDLVLQAAAGLQEVHRAGLLHGNLSPETILVTRTADDRPVVKLVRLGCMQYGTELSAGSDADTRYAAPERLAGHPLDERSDVFSLGAVLHRLLTGAPPSAVPDTSEPVSDVAWPVISKALDPVPERRFPTVAAFAEALAGLAHSARTRASTRRAARRRASAAGVVVAGLITTAYVAGLWLMRNAQRSRPDTAPVEVATARDTGAVPEAGDSGRRPSALVDAAPAPPPRQSRRQPGTEPSQPSPTEPSQHSPTEPSRRSPAEPPRRSPTNPPPATLESRVAEPGAPAMPEPAPSESLELDARLQDSLRLQLRSIAVAPPAEAHAVPPQRSAAAVPAQDTMVTPPVRTTPPNRPLTDTNVSEGAEPRLPTESHPAKELESHSGLRQALSDVRRLRIATTYEEVGPGVLVLNLGPGYWESSSVEYNLSRLYGAYSSYLQYQGAPVIELWLDGQRVGEYRGLGLPAVER